MKKVEKILSRLRGEGDSNTIEMVASQLISAAIDYRVSDIHFNEKDDEVIIRWRSDGELVSVADLPGDPGQTLARYFRVSAELPPVVADEPLEGFTEIDLPGDSSPAPVRVSSIRGRGEVKTTLRLLRTDAAALALDDLGLDFGVIDWMKNWVESGSGLLLLTGPTGSGKTTTAYALLKAMADRPINLMSIEEPIEQHIESVTQIELREEIGLDPASGLKVILRHDPDVIFIGEIRDRETARLAVQNAFCGHAVITTMHSRDTVSAVTRLRGFGIPDHEIAAALSGVLSQRLVRKAGGDGRPEGRTGIFEWWPVSQEDYYRILDGEDEMSLRERLRDRNIPTLLESGEYLSNAGVTIPRELRKVG